MTDRIEPALTAEEWANGGSLVVDGYIDWDVQIVDVNSHHSGDQGHRFIPGLIALANAALPDSDPRKITRSMVGNLRVVADALDLIAKEETEYVGHIVGRVLAAAKIREYADALASYLPPEGA